MDMHAQAEVGAPQPRGSKERTFHWVYQRVQGLMDHSIYPKPGRMEKWSFR